jgi:hypothetical protein
VRTGVTHCRTSTTLSSSRSLIDARHLTYRDVQQRQLSLEADSDVVAFGEMRVFGVDPCVYDHHRQASRFAVELTDPAI